MVVYISRVLIVNLFRQVDLQTAKNAFHTADREAAISSAKYQKNLLRTMMAAHF